MAQATLVYVLTGILKLLHPYMPFITEEIYQSLPHSAESIMIDSYPTVDEIPLFDEESADFDRIIEAISAIRARRAEMNVPPSRKAKLYISTPHKNTFKNAEPFFMKLASASGVELVESYADDGAVSIVTDSATIYIPMADMVDLEKEKARLTAELAKIHAEIARAESKLSNEGFVAKAPAAVVEAEREKLAKLKATASALEARLASM
ncbi:MAG: class I tRNA ligase family protein [Clostridia bacterium]|nr:class I tRNA ligase family protein [Clostridia bacterium]